MTEARGVKPLPNNAIALLFRGARYPLEGWRFISAHNLWGLTVVSIAINVILLIALVVGTIYWVVPWLDAVDLWVRELFTWEWWAAVAGVFAMLAWIGGITLAVALDTIILVLVGQAVASPFLDMLSEKVEALVLGHDAYPFSIGRAIRSVAVALMDLFWGIIFLVLVNVPIWVLGFWLAPAATLLSFSFNALLLSHEFVGLSLSRHLVSYRRRWGAVWRNKALGLGFGSAATAMMLIPGLNLILLPLCTVGGTLLYCDLHGAGRLGIDGLATAKPQDAAGEGSEPRLSAGG